MVSRGKIYFSRLEQFEHNYHRSLGLRTPEVGLNQGVIAYSSSSSSQGSFCGVQPLIVEKVDDQVMDGRQLMESGMLVTAIWKELTRNGITLKKKDSSMIWQADNKPFSLFLRNWSLKSDHLDLQPQWMTPKTRRVWVFLRSGGRVMWEINYHLHILSPSLLKLLLVCSLTASHFLRTGTFCENSFSECSEASESSCVYNFLLLDAAW